jgi:hypothetical protein
MAPLLFTRYRFCVYIYRTSKHYTSWVQTFPHKAAAVRPRQLPADGNRITGGLLAVERSSGALFPFRDSLQACRL